MQFFPYIAGLIVHTFYFVMNMRKTVVALVAMLLSISAFARDYGYDKEIRYRSEDDAYVDKMCRLDVAYEKGGEDRPVIVWFHGGGLTGGWRHIPEALLRDGAVVVGVGYRFATEVPVSQILDDAAASVDWVMKNIDRYGGSKSKIYLAGHSAGGYIVAMLGLDKQYLAAYDIDPDKQVAAIVPYSGQSITHFAHRKKMGIPQEKPIIDEMAPLFHVRGDAAPMLIISGDREMEMVGRYEENAYFARMLRLNGHKDVTFYEVDGFNHGDMADPAHILLLKYIRRRN